MGAGRKRLALIVAALGGPTTTATTMEAARALLDEGGPELLALDAGIPWAVPFAGTVPEEGPALLAVADADSAEGIPALLRAGADSFLVLPAGDATVEVAVSAALQGRARRRDTWSALDAARRQLLRFAEDFRVSYQREKDRSDQLALSLDRLERSYEETVRSLAAAVETKDATTGRHIERVTRSAIELARIVDPVMAREPFLAFGFLLHDLGKIGIPDRILLKPGPLTAPEVETMRAHPVIGARIVDAVEFLRPVRGVIRHHHEWWDGNGYPDSLAGLDIPKQARIFSVADAADAMLHDRPYRAALAPEVVRDRIVEGAGTQFDPEVVEAFVVVYEREDGPYARVRGGRE